MRAISSVYKRLGVLQALALGLVLLCGSALAEEADPPSRVAYISHQDGTALLALDERSGWQAASANMPLTDGARLSALARSRLEVQTDNAGIYLQGKADVTLLKLDEQTTRFALTEGSLALQVRQLAPGKRIEIDTPNLALTADQPGQYRLDVDAQSGTTQISVTRGRATVWSEAGQATPVAARARITFSGSALAIAASGSADFQDDFDRWVAARCALLEQSVTARYVSRAVPGYYQLDSHGRWAQDATYGHVWYPTITVTDWAPYRYGRWSWVSPWGWTWVDDAPWGFAPFHYGRWAQIGARWAWVPGPAAVRPVYAPALVAFVGGSSGGVQWRVSIGSTLPAGAWFPLAPGEYWHPPYHASARYHSRINHGLKPRPQHPPPRDYHFFHRPAAITVVPDHGAGSGKRPRFTDGSRLPPGTWGHDARVIAPAATARLNNHRPGTNTAGPMLRPGPDAHGMVDPRRTRTGADRQVVPRPNGAAIVRSQSIAPRSASAGTADSMLRPGPDAHGMVDPRRTRTGADRQIVPRPNGAAPIRSQSMAPRPMSAGTESGGSAATTIRQPAARVAPANPAPVRVTGPERERERLIRDARNRNGAAGAQTTAPAPQQRAATSYQPRATPARQPQQPPPNRMAQQPPKPTARTAWRMDSSPTAPAAARPAQQAPQPSRAQPSAPNIQRGAPASAHSGIRRIQSQSPRAATAGAPPMRQVAPQQPGRNSTAQSPGSGGGAFRRIQQ
ncbi:MAG: hypothetical protein LBP52_06370 [Burkholderiaceae bacterium]|jgi:hypothetical protein|nr:hypothetical protein [Burkholderiaceae bacterium]